MNKISMSVAAVHVFVLICGAVGVNMAVGAAESEINQSKFPAQASQHSGITLRGVCQLSAKPPLIFLTTAKGNSGWLSRGESWDGLTYLDFDPAKEEVTLQKSDGHVEKVQLSGVSITNSKMGVSDELIPAQELDWKWIKSDQNPMRKKAVDLPFQIVMEWDTYTQDRMTALKNYYRTHGWELSVTHIPVGVRVRFEPLENPANPRPKVAPPDATRGFALPASNQKTK